MRRKYFLRAKKPGVNPAFSLLQRNGYYLSDSASIEA
jgi:hypothetical protein